MRFAPTILSLISSLALVRAMNPAAPPAPYPHHHPLCPAHDHIIAQYADLLVHHSESTAQHVRAAAIDWSTSKTGSNAQEATSSFKLACEAAGRHLASTGGIPCPPHLVMAHPNVLDYHNAAIEYHTNQASIWKDKHDKETAAVFDHKKVLEKGVTGDEVEGAAKMDAVAKCHAKLVVFHEHAKNGIHQL